MTHHIQNVKSVAEDNVKKIRSNRQTFEKTTCSFCGRPANQFEFLDERNFVPIKGKSINGQQAVAIYGSCCLNDAKRVNDIKRAFIIEKRGENFVPNHVELYNLDNEVEEEEEDIGFKKGERVEGRQITEKVKVTDELSTGTSKGKEIEEYEPRVEEKKKPSGIFKVFKKEDE